MEKEEYLANMLPFWKKITKEQKKKLLDSAREELFLPGQSLYAGSGDCSGVFLVREGRLRVYFISENGKEITLYRLFDRDICLFSASCMMQNITFEVFVEAEKKTYVWLIPADVYGELEKESLAVSGYMNDLLASRFSDVMWVMEQVLFMSFDKRLALFLAEQSAIEQSGRLKLTQETVARHMGSAREVVSRMLKYFAEEGIVTLSRGVIEITDKEKLNQLAGFHV